MSNSHRNQPARLHLLALEDRTVPSILVWVGDVNGVWGANSGGNTNWFNQSTSTDNVIPQNGDNLQFRATGANHTSANDLNNLALNSIAFSGTDYVTGGNSIALNSLTDNSTAGSNAVTLPITLSSTVNAYVADPSTRLTLSGVISGGGGLNLIGPGVLRMTGPASNTYSSTTTVLAGTLELAKSGGAVAVGSLDISGSATVREIIGNQVADTGGVTVGAGSNFDLFGHTDTIGGLFITGTLNIGAGTLMPGSVTITGASIISTGIGKLALQGNVTVNSSSITSTILGNVDLGDATRTFTVADGSAAIDLEIDAAVSGAAEAGLIKLGSGTLDFVGSATNTYSGITTAGAGILSLSRLSGHTVVPGALNITAGFVREFASNQIGDSSTVTVHSLGLFDVNNQQEIVGSLVVAAGGKVSIGTGTLAGSVTMSGGIINAIDNGKLQPTSVTIVFPSAISTIGGTLDLGGVTRLFNIAAGPALDIPGVITNGNVQKTGAGTLTYSGSRDNTYSLTTVLEGTLVLSRSIGILAIPGDLIINGGVVSETKPNQIADTAAIAINSGGTFRLGGQFETVGTLTVVGGTLSGDGQGSGASASLVAATTSFDAASTLRLNVLDAVNSDRLVVNGSLTVGGNLQLTAPSTAPLGTVITLIDNDGTDPVTGTFTGLPEGGILAVNGQLFTISYTGGTGNDVTARRIAAPRVASTQVNDGNAQRSRITSLTLTFSAQVNFAGPLTSAFTLTRIGGGSVDFSATASVVNGVTVVTLNSFSGTETEFGSLRDGRYTLIALASQISAGGIALDGNGDGTPGDNYTFGDAQGLFRFFGDHNGDRHVDIIDFGLFSQSIFNPAIYIAAFDFNNDGHIDILDFGQFSSRIFTALP